MNPSPPPPETLPTTSRSLVDSGDLSVRSHRLESIGMLASGIAHDLNNVLSPIILAAPILRERATHPEDLQLIASLEKSAERGIALVRQIVAFANGAGAARRPVNVAEAGAELVDIATATFPSNIRLEHCFPPNLWPVMAEPAQMHQILLNLCVNARDAMPNGGVLSIRAENLLLDEARSRKIEGGQPGAWVMLEVSDTGVGISAETLAHIWEPFFTTKEPGKGTGLGLSTVRGIVDGHQGFVSVKSVPGEGTTFRIYFPAAEAASAPGPVGDLILVVDDEPQIRDMTAAMLTRLGYQVVTAGDGTKALALFAARSTEFRLVITDVIIPNLDGVALARVVKHLNPTVKVLAMSGLANDGGNAAMERVAHGFLYKPFKVQSLIDSVRTLLAAQSR